MAPGHRRLLIWLLAVFSCAAAACSSDDQDGVPDASATLDQSVPLDLARVDGRPGPAPDMAYDFCADVLAALGGAAPTTCAAAFMRDVSRCLQQPTGPCHTGEGPWELCWDDGTEGLRLMVSSVYVNAIGDHGHARCSCGGTHLFESGAALSLDPPGCVLDGDGGTCPTVQQGGLEHTNTTYTCPSGDKVVVGPLTAACRTTLGGLISLACDGTGSLGDCDRLQ